MESNIKSNPKTFHYLQKIQKRTREEIQNKYKEKQPSDKLMTTDLINWLRKIQLRINKAQLIFINRERRSPETGQKRRRLQQENIKTIYRRHESHSSVIRQNKNKSKIFIRQRNF